MIDLGGEDAIPFLVDTDREESRYESDEIVDYLETLRVSHDETPTARFSVARGNEVANEYLAGDVGNRRADNRFARVDRVSRLDVMLDRRPRAVAL